VVKEYACDTCGAPLSKSGYYSAKKRGYCRSCKPSKTETKPQGGASTVSAHTSTDDWVSPIPDPTPPPSQNDVPVEENTSSAEWLDFEFEEAQTTESIPTALKMLSSFGKGEKKTPEQIQMMHTTNLEILKMGLTATDVLITKYGQAVTLDEEYLCRHGEEDKQMVALAQYNWMMEKGIDPSSLVGTGSIAAAMTGYYVIPPVLKVRKKAKVRLFKNAGRIMSLPGRIPFIGRFFRRKKAAVVNE